MKLKLGKVHSLSVCLQLTGHLSWIVHNVGPTAAE